MRFQKITTLMCIGTACLLIQVLTSGCSIDSDWDDIIDKEDNCPDIYNPEQTDLDSDLIGDPCDPETPQGDLVVAGCYISNWPPLDGWGFSDVLTEIRELDENTDLWVLLYWPHVIGYSVEEGVGITDRARVWYDAVAMDGPYYYHSTLAEGLAEDLDGDEIADVINGTYMMLDCVSPSGECNYSDDVFIAPFERGDWHAVRTDEIDCREVK